VNVFSHSEEQLRQLKTEGMIVL